MKILIQPDDSVGKLIKAISNAKKSIEIAIFRFDSRALERALKKAIARGVHLHALIAHANNGGEANLRKLEMRLLAAGGTVVRSADDLIRYHYKMIIIDRQLLYLLAFNFTGLDMNYSRSFGVATRNPKMIQEAAKLLDADRRRLPYAATHRGLLVSPVNAREELTLLIQGAQRQLLIYDLKITDPAMIRLLEEKAKSGVEIRIIGRIDANNPEIAVRRPHIRLHARTIIRDGTHAFIGSQSLRKVELDDRREVGIVIRDRKAVAQLMKIFDEDWAAAAHSPKRPQRSELTKAAKRVARAVTKDMPPIFEVVEEAVKTVVGNKTDVELDSKEIEETVKDAVTEAVKEAVRDVVEGAVTLADHDAT